MNLDDQHFLRELGQRIRRQRLARTWTQAELGRRTRPLPAPSRAQARQRPSYARRAAFGPLQLDATHDGSWAALRRT